VIFDPSLVLGTEVEESRNEQDFPDPGWQADNVVKDDSRDDRHIHISPIATAEARTKQLTGRSRWTALESETPECGSGPVKPVVQGFSSSSPSCLRIILHNDSGISRWRGTGACCRVAGLR
jgi:hypothetical protein